jgi:diaminopimelate epimerase
MVEVERGEMEVHWRADGMVELTGPAEIVAEGTAYLEMP